MDPPRPAARAAYLRRSTHEAAQARPRPHQRRLHALAQRRADPVDHRDRRVDRLHGLSRAQPRHRFRRRPARPRRLSPSRSMSRSCAAQVDQLGVGEASIQESRQRHAPTRSACPSRTAADAAANQVVSKLRTAMSAAIIPARASMPANRSRARSARSWPGQRAWPSPSPCSASRSTSGSASNGSSASARCSRLRHDVAMTLGFFAFTQLQVDLNVVAAFLTIVGYSLNDTVVIYDRIRENLRKYRKMAILPLLNLSLNETLARTVVTSLTVLHRAWRADADRPRGHLRPGHRHLPRRPHRHLFVDLHFGRRPWSGLASSPTASSRAKRRRMPGAQPA